MVNKKPLKTIDDLRMRNGEGGYWMAIGFEDLKKEAIKWLVDIIRTEKNPFQQFREFHNITDEDLRKAHEIL